MSKKDKIIPLEHPGMPGPMPDALTELLREGAQRMLAATIEAEVEDFLVRYKDEKTANGASAWSQWSPAGVRDLDEDRGDRGVVGKIRFLSAILPPYLRRTQTLEELLPCKAAEKRKPRQLAPPGDPPRTDSTTCA
jgi:putative transposase